MAKKKKARLKRKRDDEFRSQVEADFAAKMTQDGLEYEYEPVMFYLPGGIRYKPDFAIIIDDEWYIYEIKGSWKARGAASSLKSMKMAAEKFYMFHWFKVHPKQKKTKHRPYGDWVFEEVTV